MKNDRFKQLCHFIAAVILLPLAFKLFEQKRFSPSVVFLAAGVFFLAVSGSLDWLEKTVGNSLKLVYLLECIMILLAAFFQFKNGKKMPAIAYGGAGIIYFFLFLYFLYGRDESKRKRKKHRKHHRSSSRSHGASTHPAEHKAD
jgi:O-antigen/teichoic acid export membrane protein